MRGDKQTDSPLIELIIQGRRFSCETYSVQHALTEMLREAGVIEENQTVEFLNDEQSYVASKIG